MQGITQIQGFSKRVGDGIKHHQLAISTADFMFSAFSLRNVEEESLVGRNVPGNVADRVRGFRHRANFAVFSQDIELEVRD